MSQISNWFDQWDPRSFELSRGLEQEPRGLVCGEGYYLAVGQHTDSSKTKKEPGSKGHSPAFRLYHDNEIGNPNCPAAFLSYA